MMTADDSAFPHSSVKGSLLAKGGMGIAKRIYAGEQIVSEAAIDSVSPSTGSILSNGGASFASQVYSGGIMVSKSTQASESYTTGSLVSIGGTGVALNIYAGSVIVSESTMEATAATAASLMSKGGLGVTYDMYAGEALVVTNTANADDTISGSIVTPAGITAAKSAYFGGQVVSIIDDDKRAAITDSLVLAHSTTTGAPENDIGVGISVSIEDQGDQAKSAALDFSLDDKSEGSEDVELTISLMSGGSLVTAATLTGELLTIADGMVMSTGTVSQSTNINTGVTLNAESGIITTQTATTAANSCDSFAVTNSKVLSSSIVFVSIIRYTGSLIINNPPDAKVS